jgi:uncharacterized protein YdaU (DUF1376 family)
MIWYKFHLGDYITHTLHLSDAEDLAYRRLLDLYYMSEKPIPLDTESVSRRIRLDLDITESVLSEFFEKTEIGYVNARCDAEIAKYQHQVETNRSLGKRGGRPKKTESETESKPNHNPKKIQNKNNKTISSATRFDEFWTAWPASKRKVGKAAVQAKWEKHGLDEVADVIIASVNDLKTSEQWVSGFEPAPMTYINQRRWEDDQTEQSAAPGRRVI